MAIFFIFVNPETRIGLFMTFSYVPVLTASLRLFRRKAGEKCTKALYTVYIGFVRSVHRLCTLLTVLCFSCPMPCRESSMSNSSRSTRNSY